MKSGIRFVAAVSALLMFSSCATTKSTSAQDPWEGFNRGIYAFNDVLDQFALAPIARLYRTVTPDFARDGVHNFLTNLNSPVVFFNNVLQGDAQGAFTTFWRFVLNSTLGFGGVYDFATANTNLEYRREDFGQTLGVYGTDTGPYLVLPLVGPSNTRDAVGMVADILMDPLTYILEDGWRWGYWGARVVDSRERALDLTDEIYKNSLDPYATIRSGYLQKRKAQVQNRKGASADDDSNLY